ncbi:hypothetical protein OPV22_013721 [Ensete ventricosum]|uniref:Uncharacterized protein n=1 Tax=Ensete ventricosum TaxID=4639 RepID=A0AAV8R000_ENSVE|nr:hypothetical protein OPV22_013721 [Ensete ventricosum]
MGWKSGCLRNHYYIVLKRWVKALFTNRGTGPHEPRLKPHQSDVYKPSPNSRSLVVTQVVVTAAEICLPIPLEYEEANSISEEFGFRRGNSPKTI